ncbi:MAG: hypothetical protein JSW58_06855 [Candidatus Latescibacterota bacterium]|nr:MAG: hypothetical protein JSW58_06855 [Candidatus Latescibacterota bacterium]
MIGTILFVLLYFALARQFRSWPPAARVALASVFALAGPVLALSVVARLGLNANPPIIVLVFVLFIVVAAMLRPRREMWPGNPLWLRASALALVVASLSALLGRPPTLGTLADPWAHIAWSRGLPAALDAYTPGFPAFYAILGLDDRLLGAFRMAPVVLHFVLTAQFLALSERFGKIWPGAVAALAYLVVPVAFGKFEPPRPELMGAVFITASWWILLSNHPGKRWRPLSLSVLTCVLLVSHPSILEIAFLMAMAVVVIIRKTDTDRNGRLHLLFSIGVGTAVSLLVSPFPLRFLFDTDTGPAIADRYRAITVPGIIYVARMWGFGLGLATIAGVVWIATHVRKAHRESTGVLLGLAIWFALILGPVALAAIGIQLPNTLATYRYLLSAALPLALGVTVVAGLALGSGALARFGVALCTVVIALDICLRPTFSVFLGVLALILVAGCWWILRRSPNRVVLVATNGFVFLMAIAFRLVIWLPSPPPEANWLANEGDRQTTVVTSWPMTNAFDALIPQRVLGGLAGADANLGLHRAGATTKLRDRLNWCGDINDSVVDTLRTVLGGMDALPAFLVVGDRFEEAWRAYAERWESLPQTDDPKDRPFFAADPCGEAAALRLEKIRKLLDDHSGVSRVFTTENAVIYRME